MPNWCSNSLTVSGPAADVAAFIEKAKGPTHRYIGPFNPDWSKKESAFDWGGFTPLMMEVLMDNPDTFVGGQVETLSFHSLYPVPKEVLLAPYDGNRLKEAAQKYPEWFNRFPNLIAGYDWENSNWGTKWGPSDTYVSSEYSESEGKATVSYSFESAWSPPLDFFHKIAQDWPTLTFDLDYSEPGMCFAGQTIWENGGVVFEDEREYEDESEEEEEYMSEEEEDDGICEGGG